MPQALVDKVQRAARFNQGYALGELVAAAMLDQKWHALSADAGRQDVDAFETSALATTGLVTSEVPTRYRTSYFRHIWGGGYAAGYYAYLSWKVGPTWRVVVSHVSLLGFLTLLIFYLQYLLNVLLR